MTLHNQSQTTDCSTFMIYPIYLLDGRLEEELLERPEAELLPDRETEPLFERRILELRPENDERLDEELL